jgi:hypothetical protein
MLIDETGNNADNSSAESGWTPVTSYTIHVVEVSNPDFVGATYQECVDDLSCSEISSHIEAAASTAE